MAVFDTRKTLKFKVQSSLCYKHPSWALDSWSICNADLAGGHDQKLTGRKLLRVVSQCHGELVYLGLQARPGKPKEQDAGMGNSLVKDQLTEIAVSNE